MTLPARFEPPASLKWGHFTDKQGTRLRYASLAPAAGAPKGTVVISMGFREMAEKYVEVMRDFSERGYAVWVMDWRGQGGSDRYLKDQPQRMHSEGYDEHIAALHSFVTDVVNTGGPRLLLAHSMGGHIGLRYLKEHPGIFDAAVMTSPMLDIKTEGYPRAAALALTQFVRLARKLTEYIPGGHDWNEAKDEVFEGNPYTHDAARFAVRGAVLRAKPELRMGQPTFGWLVHTFNSISKLNKESYLKSIDTPILMEVADEERIVVKEAALRAASLLPNCTGTIVPAARHELWMESDAIRQPLLDRALAFFDARVKKWNAPKGGSGPATRPQ